MKCFRCQNEGMKDETFATSAYIAVNIGRDKWHEGIGDIHVYICQKCCNELVKFLKERSLKINGTIKVTHVTGSGINAEPELRKRSKTRTGASKPLSK